MRARAVGSFVLLLIGLAGTASDSARREVTSGLALVASNYQEPPPSEALAGAWSLAWQLASGNAGQLGYPWIDATTGELVLTAANPAGETLARRWAQSGAVPMRVQTVTRSLAELERIQHGSIGPDGADLPDGDAIYMTAPDFDHNRVVITVDRLSVPLLRALAERYGTDAIAIHVDRRRPVFGY